MALSASPRTILVVDVERFSDLSRTDPQRVRVQDSLYKLLDQALGESGINFGSCYREDRGDGVIILAPPEIPKAHFSAELPNRLATVLRQHNQAHPHPEHIRLRMAVNVGEIYFTAHGVVSDDLNRTYRLLNSEPLKDTLKKTSGALAAIFSPWFYETVIWHSENFRPGIYFPVLVDQKETETVAWVTVPAAADGVPQDPRSEPWRIQLWDSEGGAAGPGILLCSRYAITSSQVAARALGLPGPGPATCPTGQVFFDLPGRPGVGRRRAEIVFWRAADANSGSPGGLGIAGLSIAGPAVRDLDKPVLQFSREPRPGIVRLQPCTADGLERPPTWARLPSHEARNGNRLLLCKLPERAPMTASEFSGSDVVDEQSGEIIGIAEISPPDSSRGDPWMTPIGKVAEEWPLLLRIAGPDPGEGENEARARSLSLTGIMKLTDRCLRTPILAEARSRHRVASELPAAVMLRAPRSSADRADLTALLWSCARVPGALNELARMIRKSPDGGRSAADVAGDLERFDA
jgi:Effector-associated domain 2